MSEMKRLFDEDDKYTPEANALDDATHKALKAIFEEYVKKGYSTRNIGEIMRGTVIDMELFYRLAYKDK